MGKFLGVPKEIMFISGVFKICLSLRALPAAIVVTVVLGIGNIAGGPSRQSTKMGMIPVLEMHRHWCLAPRTENNQRAMISPEIK